MNGRVLLAWIIAVIITAVVTHNVRAADTNTVSSTVVTDKTPPTASAPSVVVNNTDVCKSGKSAAVQTQIFGIASGITITDETRVVWMSCQELLRRRSHQVWL